MSTNLMWLLYFGDVVHGIAGICFGILIIGALSLIVWVPFGMSDGMKYPTSAIVAMVFAAAMLIITPSKQTIYASAAIYVTGEAASTEEFVLVREILKRELKKMVEEK